jgi:superfamily I DNA and RNA helicase
MRISAKQLSFFDDEPADTLQTAIPQVLKVMDLQQEQLARSLGEGHRVIHGVAGSGKTLILAYRCQHLAEAMQTVLCFNVALTSRLRKSIGLASPTLMEEKGLDKLVTVRHFHGWCTEVLKQHRLPRTDYRQYKGSEYIKHLEAAVVAAVEAGKIPIG